MQPTQSNTAFNPNAVPFSPAVQPEILLLSLSAQDFFDSQYASLIDDFHNGSRLKRARTAAGAIRYLEENNPRAILITDEGLTAGGNRLVLKKVLQYVKGGGLAVAGLHFPNFTNMKAFDKFFKAFGLPWKHGDYHRTTFQVNSSSLEGLGLQATFIPGPYSMKVLHVKGARPHEKIFIPVPDAKSQSMVFAPAAVDETQAAHVGAKIGEGRLVYIGDVNNEEDSNKFLLSLCGL